MTWIREDAETLVSPAGRREAVLFETVELGAVWLWTAEFMVTEFRAEFMAELVTEPVAEPVTELGAKNGVVWRGFSVARFEAAILEASSRRCIS